MKRVYLLSLLTSLFFAGCSQEEVIPSGENGGDGSNTSYMAVNLVSSDLARSRVKDGYEDGTEDENKVTKVRFYFFNSTGGAVNVKVTSSGGYVNYYDWEPESQSKDTDETDDIEKKLPATIVIETKKGDQLPQMIAAVLNPSDSHLEGSLNLAELKDYSENYASDALTTSGNFVMFNSVYKENLQGVNQEVVAVPISKDNLCKSEDQAKQNPVKLYVERNVAKVRMKIDKLKATDNKIRLKDKENKDITIGTKEVYLQLDGWDLTAETSKGRLVKKINRDWSGTWWNHSYRSCWAINDMSATNMYPHTWNNMQTDFTKSLYTNENAQYTDVDGTEGAAKEKTKFIIKGTLLDQDGQPITLVRHLGSHFVDTYSTDNSSENFPKLKENILAQLATNGGRYYFSTEENGKSVRKQIDITDIQIIPSDTEEKENSQNNCYVYAQLTEDAKKKTWYNSLAENAAPIEKAEETINNNLMDPKIVAWALVWKDGKTYYYDAIKHQVTDNTSDLTQYGVVRNHIYEININKIAGLGTPVYNPDEVIYPEKPDPNDHYIAAQINILSWHVVTNDYDLEW